MSDVGGVVFIVGILGLIPTAGKVLHTATKGNDVNPIEPILIFVFVMMLLVSPII